jgi:hypothetical protein
MRTPGGPVRTDAAQAGAADGAIGSEPPPRLDEAIADQVHVSTSRGRSWPGRALKPSGRRSALAALIGLALSAVLALGLLAVVVSRLAPSGVAPSGAIEWHAAAQLPATFLFGPYLASADGRLFVAGSTAQKSTTVWSSADGSTWAQVSEPGVFEQNAPGFVARSFSDDGAGGLVLVGSIADTESVVPVAWHSPDGRTWTRAQLGTPAGEIVDVAARAGQIVAYGDHLTPAGLLQTGTTLPVYSLDVWYSANGATWSHADLPDSSGYEAIAVTAWKGGFAAIGVPAYGSGWTATVWTSPDGSTWQRAPTDLDGLGPSTMAGLGDRVVALGSRLDSKLGMVPASWSSTDGRTWVDSKASVRDPAMMFDDVTVAGDTLVAIGSSHEANDQVAGVPNSTPPPASEGIWTSGDGATWSLLPADPSLNLGPYLDTHVTGFGGRVVIATQAGDAVEVFVGDLAR